MRYGIEITGNDRIDTATAEIAVALRDGSPGRRDQHYYDEAQRLRDAIMAGQQELSAPLPCGEMGARVVIGYKPMAAPPAWTGQPESQVIVHTQPAGIAIATSPSPDSRAASSGTDSGGQVRSAMAGESSQPHRSESTT